ncbi:amino acid ABC transporter permease [Albidovulum sp.]|uniref:amino acid ABC transporter permease n=1 Tax=Albidovulum sp. TaxID=1872424 RepID=UPI0039B8B19E
MTEILLSILAGVPWTIALTAASLLIGTVAGAILCAMRLSGSALPRLASAGIILTFRSIPPIVWLFFIFFGIGTNLLPLSPFASGAIGLGLITAANMAEIFRGAFAAIHPGQWEAARTLNLGRVSQMLDVIGPQVVRVALPSIATYAIGLLKDSAVASTIGVTETAFQAYHVSQRTFHGLDVYAIAGLLYILLSLPIAALSRRLDLHLRAKVAR